MNGINIRLDYFAEERPEAVDAVMRRLIFRKFQYRCADCGKTVKFRKYRPRKQMAHLIREHNWKSMNYASRRNREVGHVHHVIPQGYCGGKATIDNLRLLCTDCHSKVHLEMRK